MLLTTIQLIQLGHLYQQYLRDKKQHHLPQLQKVQVEPLSFHQLLILGKILQMELTIIVMREVFSSWFIRLIY